LREQVNETPGHEQDAEEYRNQQDCRRKSFHIPNVTPVDSGLGHASIAAKLRPCC
jgi:hypothetical protein